MILKISQKDWGIKYMMNNNCNENNCLDQEHLLINQLNDVLINIQQQILDNNITGFQSLILLINLNNHTENHPISNELEFFIDSICRQGFITQDQNHNQSIDFSEGPILDWRDLKETSFDETKNLRFFHFFENNFNTLIKNIVKINTENYYRNNFYNDSDDE